MKQVLLVLTLIFTLGNLAAQDRKTGLPEVKNELPEFPGGKSELDQFIKKNLAIPEKYKNDPAFKECEVHVKFTVDESGQIIQPKISKGCLGFDECDKEALRIVGMMPQWKPARRNNTPVKRGYNLIIPFKKN